MFCKKCGNQVAAGAAFCNKCGAPLKGEAGQAGSGTGGKRRIVRAPKRGGRGSGEPAGAWA